MRLILYLSLVHRWGDWERGTVPACSRAGLKLGYQTPTLPAQTTTLNSQQTAKASGWSWTHQELGTPWGGVTNYVRTTLSRYSPIFLKKEVEVWSEPQWKLNSYLGFLVYNVWTLSTASVVIVALSPLRPSGRVWWCSDLKCLGVLFSASLQVILLP